MSNENLVSVEFTPEEVQQINAAMEVLTTVLLPKLIAQTATETRRRSKMKDKTLPFVLKAYEHALQNPKLVPQFMDLLEFKKDINVHELLRNILSLMKEMNSNIEDTMSVAGSEAYKAARTFYKSVKQAALNNVPGAKVIAEDLAKRFDGNGRRRKGGNDSPSKE